MKEALHLWHEQESVSGDKLRLDQVAKPMAYAMAGHQRHAILIADASGNIRFAATRNLLGWSDEDLPDSHLQLLVPTLPVRAGTPGYNVAYVRMNFADQGWQTHRARCADGKDLSVQLSVRTLPIGRGYALLIAVREMPRAQISFGALARSSPCYAGALAA